MIVPEDRKKYKLRMDNSLKTRLLMIFGRHKGEWLDEVDLLNGSGDLITSKTNKYRSLRKELGSLLRTRDILKKIEKVNGEDIPYYTMNVELFFKQLGEFMQDYDSTMQLASELGITASEEIFALQDVALRKWDQKNSSNSHQKRQKK